MTHLSNATIINALWDLWDRLVKNPVWQSLSNLEPGTAEQLVASVDFRYLSNVITKGKGLELLKRLCRKKEKLKELLGKGYPCYTSQASWLGYSNEKIALLTVSCIKSFPFSGLTYMLTLNTVL